MCDRWQSMFEQVVIALALAGAVWLVRQGLGSEHEGPILSNAAGPGADQRRGRACSGCAACPGGARSTCGMPQ
jgi:hypothetical protein